MSIEYIRSFIRRALPKEKLNILVIGVTHERYESTLCATEHNFYVYVPPGYKEWDKRYSQIPKNYYIANYIPDYIDYDLILCHVSDDRLQIAYNLSNIFNIPIIRHTHTVPTSKSEIEAHQSAIPHVQLNTFISNYSKLVWGYENVENAKTINHGIHTDFWCRGKGSKREKHALSVVNFWKDRDWACGWNIWNEEVRPYVKTCVVGDNPGLSEPLQASELRSLYNNSLLFVNTSLNSPIPMSVLEAMACGCCVISLPTCMIPEIIKNGENGILCNDGLEIVDACKYLSSNPEKAEQLGKNAQKTILKKYNLKKFVKNWNTTFEKVLYK